MRLEALLILLIVPGALLTTVLGWISVTQIRRSAGKLHGLWLAVLDGLLFPLIALFGLIALLTREFAMGFLGWPPDDQVRNSQGIFVSAALFALASFFIVRAVWRAVNTIPNPPVVHGRVSPGKAIAMGCGILPAVSSAPSKAER